MSTLESILTLLEKWSPWKRITESPSRIDQLEQRVAALEGKLVRRPGEECPKCGELSMRAVRETDAPGALAVMGVRSQESRCEACGYESKALLGDRHDRSRR